ncbi:distal tail protein Dit [Mediterraneibacter gnavus]|uniref:distal tail protein Dit n=3 Tax=Mediterraneibacter gnavus TaxID=33038 RepID=UPI00232C8004|nr:distal tail protein Dit [Mediterraneibacter gnavus]MDB8712079.1 phage tail family protein [Mediterraneibacter gnavus]MDB8715116.1 phage tail family protein [Mediterraneibacter gnavus]
MTLSVKFNDIELGKYIKVLQGFTPFVGADWNPSFVKAEKQNGSDFAYTSYENKQIVMPFTIEGNLEEKYDALQKALKVDEPKKLVFGNVPNKCFYAVPSGTLEFSEETEFLGEGSITWLIPDGVAYSTAEFDFYGVQQNGYQTITIKNNGTEWADVDYEITHQHENGFIGLVSQYGVIQLGKEEEADGENYKASENLFDGYNLFQDDHGTSYQNPENTTQGTLEVRNVAGYSVMALKGGQATSGYWNGGMKTLTIPVDSEGKRGAKNFYCYTQHWFETGLMGQTGAQTIAFLTGDNKVICAMSINKSDSVGNTARIEWFAPGNTLIRREEFQPTAYEGNPFNLKMGCHNDFLKEGEKLRIFWYGTYMERNIPEIKDMECEKIQVWIGQWGDRNLSNQYVTHNYLKSIRFRKDNVDKYKDVPNRYRAGDVVSIDGESTKVYVNGMPAKGDEITGSNYPKVPPGTTEVQFCYSSFSSPPPQIKAKIREVYL